MLLFLILMGIFLPIIVAFSITYYFLPKPAFMYNWIEELEEYAPDSVALIFIPVINIIHMLMAIVFYLKDKKVFSTTDRFNRIRVK